MKVIYKDNNHKLIELDPRNLNDIKVEKVYLVSSHSDGTINIY